MNTESMNVENPFIGRQISIANLNTASEKYHEPDDDKGLRWLQGDEAQRRFKKPKWRPTRSVTSQSLPDTVSTISSEDDVPVARFLQSDGDDAAMQLVGKDIRGEIADGCRIALNFDDGGVHKPTFWNGEPGWDHDWQGEYMKAWVDEMSKSKVPKARFLKKNLAGHENRDVNTFDGKLCKPVDYPETTINPEDLRNFNEELPRRLVDTSESRSKPEMEKHKRRVKNLKNKRNREGVHPYLWGNAVNEVPLKISELDPDTICPGDAKVMFFMRPARKSDLAAILQIYNWEVANGTQALDNKPLTLKDFERIFEQCDKAETPFIVAVGGKSSRVVAREHKALVRKRTQASRQWQHVGQHGLDPKDPDQQQQDPTHGPIVAFGFVTIPTQGLAGDVHFNVGRFDGRIHMYVAHESRRNGIGSVLLGRLTACCSERMSTMNALHDGWFDGDEVKACKPALLGARQYLSVSVEFAFCDQEDAEIKWLSGMLLKEGYEHSYTLTKARKVGLGEAGQWLNVQVWHIMCRDESSDIKAEGPPKNPWA